MREIKFRAWDKQAGGGMIPHDKLIFQMAIVEDDKERHVRRMRVDYREEFYKDLQRKYELMQFTGLKDKNGKPIYEGDIITTGLFGTEYHDKKQFRVVEWQDFGWNLRKRKPSQEFEIIGNIYENPDLLK